MVLSSVTEVAGPRLCGLAIYDDPGLYDLLVSSAPEEAFYRDAARRSAGPVLELACGTGRLAIPLARCGLAVTGLDISRSMLAAARAKAAAAGAAVSWIEADMRCFALPQRFAMIFIAINSLLHLTDLDDLRACLACVRRHLASKGILVFDIFSPNVCLLARDPAERRLLGSFTDPQRGDIRVEETTEYDAAAQVVRSTLYVSFCGQLESRMAPVELRQIFPQELPLLLQACGLGLQARYGDFSRRPFTSRSPHQVCVCRRL